MAELVLDALAVTRGARTLLHPVSARIAGGFTAVVGPNGAGKSTLLRAVAGLIPATGTARLDGQTVAGLAPLARARALSYLPQQHDFAWPICAREMVALGQYAFGTQLAAVAPHAPVDAAMAACGITGLADQPVDQLSGGERALVALARVLVGNTRVLLLDEPVAALDIARQFAILDHLAALAASGQTIIAVLHDIALVAQFADRVLWLQQGTLVADTDASIAAIDQQTQAIFGRTLHWSAGVPSFRR